MSAASLKIKQELYLLKYEKARRLAQQRLINFIKWTKPDYEVAWHHRVICREVERFLHSDEVLLVLGMPPRHGKSEIVSRRLPAYLFGQNPNLKIISASYAADLASRMNRDVQRILMDPLYSQVFPDTKIGEKNSRTDSKMSYLRNSDIFEIVDATGTYRSAGVGGGITGMGADILLIDDPVKNWEEAKSENDREKKWDWYASTAFTRLEKNGKVIIIMTRWHEDDLAGRAIENARANNMKYSVINFEAIKESMENPLDTRELGEALWPTKYATKQLEDIKKTLGAQVWSALYQQRPTSLEGGIIKRSWLKFYRTPPARWDEQIQSWDLTFKGTPGSDYVVGSLWGRVGADKYLLDLVRARLDFPETIQAFKTFSAKHPKAFAKLVEAKANGPALIDSLKGKIPGIIPFEVKGSKEERLSMVAPDFEAGNIWLPDPELAPWVHDFIHELVSFPTAAHDDQVDVTSQALLRFRTSARDLLTKLTKM
jgi:predicted phage terminase large subunit-like protein